MFPDFPGHQKTGATQQLQLTLLNVDNVQKPINEENKSIRDAGGRDINNIMIVVWSHWAHSALRQSGRNVSKNVGSLYTSDQAGAVFKLSRLAKDRSSIALN